MITAERMEAELGKAIIWIYEDGDYGVELDQRLQHFIDKLMIHIP